MMQLMCMLLRIAYNQWHDYWYIYTNTFHDARLPPIHCRIQNKHALYHCIIVGKNILFRWLLYMDTKAIALQTILIKTSWVRGKLERFISCRIIKRTSKVYQRERISQKQFSSLFLVVLAIVLLVRMPPKVMLTLAYLSKVQQKTNVGCVQNKFWLTSKVYLSGPFIKPPRQCLHFFGSMWE